MRRNYRLAALIWVPILLVSTVWFVVGNSQHVFDPPHYGFGSDITVSYPSQQVKGQTYTLTITVSHPRVSTEWEDFSLVGADWWNPSDWNAQHAFLGGSGCQYSTLPYSVGRTTRPSANFTCPGQPEGSTMVYQIPFRATAPGAGGYDLYAYSPQGALGSVPPTVATGGASGIEAHLSDRVTAP